MESTTAAAIWPYWIPLAVTKASAPTVTGCLSAEASTSAKMKLFQAKMKAALERRGVELLEESPLVLLEALRVETALLEEAEVEEAEVEEAEVEARGIYQMRIRPSGSGLILGDHPVADTIRALGIGSKPLVTRYYIERAAILPRGSAWRIVSTSSRASRMASKGGT